MIRHSFGLVLLRKLPIQCFSFPRWKSVLAVTFVGFLTGLSFAENGMVDAEHFPLPVTIGAGMVASWAAFILVYVILNWWVRRGARWDGKGDLFNLLAAATLFSGIVSGVLFLFIDSPVVMLVVWLYSILIAVEALSATMENVTRIYSLCGVLMAQVISMFFCALLLVTLFPIFLRFIKN